VTQGRFITFEGGEGTGKSTQATRLVDWLRRRDLEVVQTREPGGSTGAEDIRNIALNGDAGRWSPMTETLLMFAARSDHLEKTIRPALDAGRWVVCDRFADSTKAYQGYGRGVDLAWLDTLQREACAGLRPQLTLLLDVPAETAWQRLAGSRPDRFGGRGPEFLRRVREGYLALAAAEPDRVQVVDAARPLEAVWEQVRQVLELRLRAGTGSGVEGPEIGSGHRAG